MEEMKKNNNSIRRILVAALFLSLAAGMPAWAEILSIGVKGGVPLTDAFNTARSGSLSYFSETKRYTVGPTVELHLPLRFSIELDALYTRLNYGSNNATEEGFLATQTERSFRS